jgi:chromosome segregation ATPase
MAGFIKSLFVKESPTEAPADAAPVTEVAEETAPAAAPAKNSRYRGTTRAGAATETAGSNSSVDQNILAGLQDAIEKGKSAGYGYLEFSETLSNMEKSIPDEETRFKAAGASAKAMKCSPSKIISSAQQALEVLSEEEETLKRELADAEALDAEKRSQIEDFDKQIKTLESQIKALETKKTKVADEIVASETKTAEAKGRFMATKNFLAKKINSDISKITEYLSK